MDDYILVVDDNLDAREILQDAITALGHEVIAVDSGLAALEQAEKHLPRLILLDVMMPGMSGLQVLTRLRSVPATRDLPVVVISASAVADIDPRRLPGNTHVMPKAGFHIHELQGIVSDLMSDDSPAD